MPFRHRPPVVQDQLRIGQTERGQHLDDLLIGIIQIDPYGLVVAILDESGCVQAFKVARGNFRIDNSSVERRSCKQKGIREPLRNSPIKIARICQNAADGAVAAGTPDVLWM